CTPCAIAGPYTTLFRSQNGHGGSHIQSLLALDAVGNGGGAAYLGQTQGAEQANPHPAHVELPFLHRQLGRIGVGMMIVMQFFARSEEHTSELQSRENLV